MGGAWAALSLAPPHLAHPPLGPSEKSPGLPILGQLERAGC